MRISLAEICAAPMGGGVYSNGRKRDWQMQRYEESSKKAIERLVGLRGSWRSHTFSKRKFF